MISFKKWKTKSGWTRKQKKGISVSLFSICEQVLLYADSCNAIYSAKENSERISYWPSRDIENEISNERLYLLVKDEPKHTKFGETVPRMPTSSKGFTGKDSTMAKDRCPMDLMAYDYTGPLNGSYYLSIVDSFTKWPEIVKYRHPFATNTINALNENFSFFGVPKTLVSNKGMQFAGREFKEFYTSLSIDHGTTTVYHPKSNGQAEKFMDTFKRALS